MTGTAASASDVLKSLLNESRSSNLLRPSSKVVRDKQVTLSSGKRIMLRAKNKETKEKEKKAVLGMAADENTLECVNMPLLWEKLRIEEITKRELNAFEKSKKLLEESGRELQELTSTKGKKMKVNSLWTEKYRPRKFIDLIGNERVNASILKWLGDWTYAVKGGKLIDSNTYDRSMHVDPLKRPRKKILLIHGPPGIGKTTIAQCVCKQLGYQIQEINSSDERSGMAVREKVKNALKMRSLSGKDVCLLLDEIDGAAGNENGFIKVLVGLLNKDIRATEEWNSFNRLKWNKREDFLKRPIIALCNDVGAHCLDQLKPFCEIVQFKKSSKKSIKKRLKMILEAERLGEMNESLLDDLIISLDGDIRNCINFLQFNSRDLNGRIKDSEVVWFQLLKDIFNLENKNVTNNKSKSEIFRDLMTKLSNSASDLSRISNGCFNLMLQVNEEYGGGNLAKLDEVSDWLYFDDVMAQHYRHFEREELSMYGAITPLKFFSLFANFSDGGFYDRRERFNFKSQEDHDTRRRVHDLVGCLVPQYGFAVTRERLVSDELALLNAIVVPTERPVKELEHDESRLRTIAGVLDALKIRIDAAPGGSRGRFGHHGGGGSSSYMAPRRFGPDIVAGLVESAGAARGAVGGDDKRANSDAARDTGSLNEVRAMPYIRAIDEYLARSRRGDAAARQKREREADAGTGEPATRKRPAGDGAPAPADREAVSTVDFFRKQYSSFHAQLNHPEGGVTGGSAGTATAPARGAAGVMHKNENRIWVKYHEGFSNAVRKEITLRSLLT